MSRTALTGVLIFGVCALIRIALVDRHGLWADEFFSLAMATGHSLEHPADRAEPAFEDFVEAPRALPPAAYSRYLEHGVPPGSPRRVVRAVLLSDTNPPLYYLLLYGWTRALGTGDAVLRLFSVLCSLACFPVLWSLARRFGGGGAAVSTCILFAVSPLMRFLFHGRPHVFVAHALQRLFDVAHPQAVGQGSKCVEVLALGRGGRCRSAHSLFLSLRLDRRGFLAAVSSRPVPTMALGGGCSPDRPAGPAVVRPRSRESWRSGA